eukprot:755174-Hanusia_phi.AAC.5
MLAILLLMIFKQLCYGDYLLSTFSEGRGRGVMFVEIMVVNDPTCRLLFLLPSLLCGMACGKAQQERLSLYLARIQKRCCTMLRRVGSERQDCVRGLLRAQLVRHNLLWNERDGKMYIRHVNANRSSNLMSSLSLLPHVNEEASTLASHLSVAHHKFEVFATRRLCCVVGMYECQTRRADHNQTTSGDRKLIFLRCSTTTALPLPVRPASCKGLAGWSRTSPASSTATSSSQQARAACTSPTRPAARSGSWTWR